MKNFKLTIVFAFMAIAATAQHNIKVTITDLASSDGVVMVELSDVNNKTVAQQAVEITNNKSELTFENVDPGTYAIRYYHDENKNEKMDTGLFGIPEEGYGFSNNAKGFMGPPDFEDQLFEVNKDLELTLETNN